MSENTLQQSTLRITISEVKALLEQGKSRKEIAEYYGRNQAEMKRMVWSNPKLKNLKAKKQYNDIELVDDDVEMTPVVEVNNQITDAVTLSEPEITFIPTNVQDEVETQGVDQNWN